MFPRVNALPVADSSVARGDVLEPQMTQNYERATVCDWTML
jgi:hypothetical protein